MKNALDETICRSWAIQEPVRTVKMQVQARINTKRQNYIPFLEKIN
jgi:hypothetical protein